jgi:hypothetical protein
MTLKSELNAKTNAPQKNPVDKLLTELESSEDYDVLRDALVNPEVPALALTKALRRTYGKRVVKDDSVKLWREQHLREVTGL